MKKYLFLSIISIFSLIFNQINAKSKILSKENYVIVERKAPEKNFNVVKNSLMSLYDKEPKEATIEIPFNNVNQKFFIEKKDADFYDSFTLLSDGRLFSGKKNTGVNYIVKNEYQEYCGQLAIYEDNIFCDITHLGETFNITSDNKGCVKVDYINENTEKYNNIIELLTKNESFKNTEISKNIQVKLDSISQIENKSDEIKPLKKDLELDFLTNDNDGVVPSDGPLAVDFNNRGRNPNTGDNACMSIPLYINVSYDYYLKSQHPNSVQTSLDSSAYKHVNQKIRYYFNRAIQIYEAQSIFLHIGFIYIRTTNDLNAQNQDYWLSILGQIKYQNHNAEKKYYWPGFFQGGGPKEFFENYEGDDPNIWDIGGEWRLSRKIFKASPFDYSYSSRKYTWGLDDYLQEGLFNNVLGKYYYTNSAGLKDSAYQKPYDMPHGLFIYIGETKLAWDNANPTNGSSTSSDVDEIIRRYTSTNQNVGENKNYEGNVFGTGANDDEPRLNPGYNTRNFLPMYSNMPNNLTDLTTTVDGGCHLKEIGYYYNGADTRYWADGIGWHNNNSAFTFALSIIPLLGDSSYYTYDPPPYTSANGVYPPPLVNNVKFNIKDHVQLYGEKEEFGNTDYPVFNLAKWNTWMIVHHIAGQLGARIFHDIYIRNDILSPIARNYNVNPVNYTFALGSPRPHNEPTVFDEYSHEINSMGEALKQYTSRYFLDNALQATGASIYTPSFKSSNMSNWNKTISVAASPTFWNSLILPLIIPGGNPIGIGVIDWWTFIAAWTQNHIFSNPGTTILAGTWSQSKTHWMSNMSPGGFQGWVTNALTSQQYVYGKLWLGVPLVQIGIGYAWMAIGFNLLDIAKFYVEYGGDHNQLSGYYEYWNENWPEINDGRIFGEIGYRQTNPYGFLDLNLIPGFSPVDFVSFSKGINKRTVMDIKLMLTSRAMGNVNPIYFSHTRDNPYAEINNDNTTKYAVGGDTILLTANDSVLVRTFRTDPIGAGWIPRPDSIISANERIILKNFIINAIGSIGGTRYPRSFYLTGYEASVRIKDSLSFTWRANNQTISTSSTATLPLPTVQTLTMYPVTLNTIGRSRDDLGTGFSSTGDLKRSSIWTKRMDFAKSYPGLDTNKFKHLVENKVQYFPISGHLINNNCKSNTAVKYIRLYPIKFLPIEEKFGNWLSNNQSLLNWEFISPWSSGDGPSEYKIWQNGHYVKGTGPIRDKRMLAGTGWARATNEFKNLLAGPQTNWDGLVYIPRKQTPPLATKNLQYYDWDISGSNVSFDNLSPRNTVKFRGQVGNLPPSPFKNWYSKMGFPTGNRRIYPNKFQTKYPDFLDDMENDLLKDGVSINGLSRYVLNRNVDLWPNRFYPNHCAYDYWRRFTVDTARSPMYLNNNTENNLLVVSFDFSGFVIGKNLMRQTGTPYSPFFTPTSPIFNTPYIKNAAKVENIYYTYAQYLFRTFGGAKLVTKRVCNVETLYDVVSGDTSTLKRDVYIGSMSDTLALIMYLNGNIKNPIVIWKKGGDDLMSITHGEYLIDEDPDYTSSSTGYLSGFDMRGLPYGFTQIKGNLRETCTNRVFPNWPWGGTMDLSGGQPLLNEVTETYFWFPSRINDFMSHKVWHKPKALYDKREWSRISVDISQYDTAKSVQFDFQYFNNDSYSGLTRNDGVASRDYETFGNFADGVSTAEYNSILLRGYEYDLGSRHSPLFITNFKVYSTGQLPLLNGLVEQQPDSGTEVGCDKCVNIRLKMPQGHNATSYQIHRLNADGINSTIISSGNIPNTYFANPNDTGYTPNDSATYGDINVCNIRYGQTATFFAKIINTSGNTVQDTLYTQVFTVINTCEPCRVKPVTLSADSSFNRDRTYKIQANFENIHNGRFLTLQRYNPDIGWETISGNYTNLTDPLGAILWNNNSNIALGGNNIYSHTFPQFTNQSQGEKKYRAVLSNPNCEPTSAISQISSVVVCPGCKTLAKPSISVDSSYNVGIKYNITVELQPLSNATTIEIYEKNINSTSVGYGTRIFGATINPLSLNPYTKTITITNKLAGEYYYVAIVKTTPQFAQLGSNIRVSDAVKVVVSGFYFCSAINPDIFKTFSGSGGVLNLRFNINPNCLIKNVVRIYRLNSTQSYLNSDPTLTEEILNTLPIGQPSILFGTTNAPEITFTNEEISSLIFNRKITPDIKVYNRWYKVEIKCQSCSNVANTISFFKFIKNPSIPPQD